MSTIPEFEALARNAADALHDRHGIECTTDNPLSEFMGWAVTTDLTDLVREAVINDRKQRGLVEAVAEVLDDRDADEAAQLVRDTDPDDDLWKNYFGPMLDELEADYSSFAEALGE